MVPSPSRITAPGLLVVCLWLAAGLSPEAARPALAAPKEQQGGEQGGGEPIVIGRSHELESAVLLARSFIPQHWKACAGCLRSSRIPTPTRSSAHPSSQALSALARSHNRDIQLSGHSLHSRAERGDQIRPVRGAIEALGRIGDQVEELGLA